MLLISYYWQVGIAGVYCHIQWFCILICTRFPSPPQGEGKWELIIVCTHENKRGRQNLKAVQRGVADARLWNQQSQKTITFFKHVKCFKDYLCSRSLCYCTQRIWIWYAEHHCSQEDWTKMYPLMYEQISEFPFCLGMMYGECISNMKSEEQKRDSY